MTIDVTPSAAPRRLPVLSPRRAPRPFRAARTICAASAAALATLALALAATLSACGEPREAGALPSADRPPDRGGASTSAPRGSGAGASRDPSIGSVEPGADEPLLDRLGDAPTPEEEAAAEAMPSPLGSRPPPARGCALQSDAPLRVLTNAGPPAIVAHADAFLVAAYDQRGVTIVRARPGALPEPVASIPLDAASSRVAAPALERTAENELTLALVDGRGRVLTAALDPAVGATAPIAHEVAASGADPRFSPVVRAIGTRRAIAWTDGTGTPMRLELALIEHGARVAAHDVTPAAGGGAAPTFVDGDDAPVLLFIDPRVGISVVHRVRLGTDGTPGPTEVARPLNLAAEPPAIAVARARTTARTWLAYAAVGNLATRAVGLVDASGTEMPSPLVPGVGYGEPLGVDAVASDHAVVFAVEAPSAAAEHAPHEVRMRRVDDAGPGDPLVVASPATDPALARRADGLLAVAYRSGDTLLVHFARCAE